MLTLNGADQLAATAHRAARDVPALVAAWGERAGEVVVAAVHPPIRTGALARTVHVVTTDQGFGIAAGGPTAPYVAIVNARRPFLAPAFHARESAVVDTAADLLDKLVGTIKGA